MSNTSHMNVNVTLKMCTSFTHVSHSMYCDFDTSFLTLNMHYGFLLTGKSSHNSFKLLSRVLAVIRKPEHVQRLTWQQTLVPSLQI